MVTLSMDVLYMLVVSGPQVTYCSLLSRDNQTREPATVVETALTLGVPSLKVAEEFVRQGGLSLLEAIQYNSEGEIRRRATHLLEDHLVSYSSYCSVNTVFRLLN